MQTGADFHRDETLSFPIKGVRVAAVDVFVAADLLQALAQSDKGEYVTITGAHGIVESVDNKSICEAHQHAALVVADGMPLVWLGRLKGFPTTGRVNGPELMEVFFADQTNRTLKHFFYGSNPETVVKLRDMLVKRFGEFNLVGYYCPPIRPLGFCEEDEILDRIRALAPNIIWIGLSTPKQELWMHMHMSKIGRGVGVGVGAAFDLLSGQTLRAPRWIQRSGFEWLFRLCVEPRRLYRRYIKVIPRFAYFFFAAITSH